MYMVYCKDPNCVKCKEALEGQISEETQTKYLKTVEELLSLELLLAAKEKATCLETCRKLKDEVHCKVNGLIDILKEREHDLCNQIDLEYATQVAKIDYDVTVTCTDKLLKKNSEPEKLPMKFQPIFLSDFDDLKRKLQNFGFLGCEAEELLPTSFASPLAVDSTATPVSRKDKNCELPTLNENYLKELEKLDGKVGEYTQMKNPELLKINEEYEDYLKEFQKFDAKAAEYTQTKKTSTKLDKKDIKAMSTEEKLSEVLNLGKEMSSMQYFLQTAMLDQRLMQLGANKINRESPKPAEPKSKDSFQSEERESPKLTEPKSKDTFEGSLDEDGIEFINRNEVTNIPSGFPLYPPLPPQQSWFGMKRPSFVSFLPKKGSKCACSGIFKKKSHGCSTTLKNSSTSSGFNTENASINDQQRESSSIGSIGEDPSAALLASFANYLEKNDASDWLAPKKSSEHLLSSGNNCISYESFVDKKDADLYEWLPKENMIMNSN
ncbi:uncharacterized protein LOC129987993 [Argiope bruennichi]|uniref:uncharacterized protein LOC129987993 n=1 Tax=Argiope bruennichi TaxID=94029 RepID=UPI00249498AF|nr:uncharacterized protein LOC129987993 [Argiope bruennichi]